MTKEEVIKVMGHPDTVGADGSFEYLNYRVTSPTGYGTTTQGYTVRLVDNKVVSYGLGTPFNFPVRPVATTQTRSISENPSASANGVRIISIEPSAAPADKPTQFTLKIAYSIKEASGGSLQISFNTISAKGFTVAMTKSLGVGIGEIEVLATVTPKDWGKLDAFCASAMVRNEENRVLAMHRHDITVLP